MKIEYWLGLIFVISLAVIYSFQGYYPESMKFLSAAFPPFIAGAAALMAAIALQNYWEGFGSIISRIWFCFTLGMILWFIGGVGWVIFKVILKIEHPYSSLADAFWLSGLVPISIALLMYIQTVRPALSKRMIRTAGAIACVAGVAIFTPLIISAVVVEETLITLAVDVAYPALDLVFFQRRS